jgi:excisionase family DNA binding protein
MHDAGRTVLPKRARRDGLEQQLFTVEEAARMLACTEAAIRKWVSQGRLHRVKLGRLTRLRAQDIADVIAHGLPEARCFQRNRRLHSAADKPTLPPCNSGSATGGSGVATQCGS